MVIFLFVINLNTFWCLAITSSSNYLFFKRSNCFQNQKQHHQMMSATPPASFLHLSQPFQDVSSFITPTTLTMWDDVNGHIALINDHTVHFAPIHHQTLTANSSDEEFNSMIERSDPPILTFEIPHDMFKSSITEAKLSPNRTKLSLVDNDKHLLILNTENMSTRPVGVSIFCKDGREMETKILGMYWVNDTQILIILTTSIQFISLKNIPGSLSSTGLPQMQSKIVKNFAVQTRFFIYSPECGILLVAQHGESALSPFKVYEMNPNNFNIAKLAKFEVGMPDSESEIQQNELHIVKLYGRNWCLHLSSIRQEMTIFKITNENTFVKLRVCNLYAQGILHVSVVDSLILVHNSIDNHTMAYDIVARHDKPVSPPMSLSPGNNTVPIQLYASDWTFIYPNYVFDRQTGLVFELFITIDQMPLNMRNKSESIKLLLRRSNSKMTVLKRIKSFITDRKETLRNISSIFKVVNRHYLSVLRTDRQRKQSLQTQNNNNNNNNNNDVLRRQSLSLPTIDFSASDDGNNQISDDSSTGLNCVYVEQADMYRHVLSPLDEEELDGNDDTCAVTTTELIAIVVEYIRSLKAYGLSVQHVLQKFLIELLIKNNDYYLLHEYVQYKVIDDSIPIAWQILHISSQYEPAYQISLDMMSRLQAHENICEILISRREVSQALQLMYRHRISNIPYRVIFEIVMEMKDKTLFYNTMEILSKCNVRNRGSSAFTKEDKCDEFVEMYNRMFGKHQQVIG